MLELEWTEEKVTWNFKSVTVHLFLYWLFGHSII